MNLAYGNPRYTAVADHCALILLRERHSRES